MITKPMLAGAVEDVAKLTYPLIASPKIDGIRALTLGGKLLSRSLKPIPNRHIRETLERVAPDGLDGELLVGDTFQAATSAIMSHDGEPDFRFWCFDYVDMKRHGALSVPYQDRLPFLTDAVRLTGDPRVVVVPTQEIGSREQLDAYEAEALELGFEGVMLRRPEGPYKCGRSTWKEGYLLKLKRFEDAEAIVIGFEEQMHNANEATTNELGRTKRSTHAAGLVPKGTLGALRVRLLTPTGDGALVAAGTRAGVEFNIGTGMDDRLRSEVWANRDRYMGSIVKFKHQPHGAKDAPRLPVFLGFRGPADL